MKVIKKGEGTYNYCGIGVSLEMLFSLTNSEIMMCFKENLKVQGTPRVYKGYFSFESLASHDKIFKGCHGEEIIKLISSLIETHKFSISLENDQILFSLFIDSRKVQLAIPKFEKNNQETYKKISALIGILNKKAQCYKNFIKKLQKEMKPLKEEIAKEKEEKERLRKEILSLKKILTTEKYQGFTIDFAKEIESLKSSQDLVLLETREIKDFLAKKETNYSKVSSTKRKNESLVSSTILSEFHQKNFDSNWNKRSKKEGKRSIKHFFSVIGHKLNLLYTMKQHNLIVSSLCLLEDGRIASSSIDNTIKIHNMQTNQCDILINEQKNVTYLSELDNGCLLSSSSDKTIKIWKIEQYSYYLVHTLEGHKEGVLKAIPLSMSRIGSCSFDKTIKIWNSTAPYDCIQTLTGHSGWITSIIELKNKQNLVSGSDDLQLIFWNNISYEKDYILDDIKCVDNNSLYEISNNRLIIGGKDTITIVSFHPEPNIEKIITDHDMGTVYSFLEMIGGNIICGCGDYNNGHFYVVDGKDYKIISKHKKAHDGYITSIIDLCEDNLFASGSYDKTIKFWNY